jgi:signal transduction histidine kinase
MRVEQSRIKLIKTEFESKLLFENPLINDAAVKGLSDEFSENIINYYKDLPKDKSFVCSIDFEDAVCFWLNSGEMCRSANPQMANVPESEMLFNLALEITEYGQPTFFSDHIIDDKKYDILIVKEEDGVFGMLKESLSHGVLVQLANLTSRVQELERKRLSLDLHDSVTQHLSGIKFLLSALKNESSKSNSIVSKCKKAIDAAINETRMVSRNLMPLKLEEKGFDVVLNELRERLELHYRVLMTIQNDSNFGLLSNNFQLTVYRIIQELCSNSIKHGKCSEININFNSTGEKLDFNYCDNGKGFDIDNYNKSRMGMSNIYYRIFQFGGELDIESVKKMGVNYYFTFPLSKIEKV